MARDYRHGHGQKPGFTRKSQQTSHQLEKRSVSLIWGAGFLVSAVLLVGFFVTQHFVSQGAKSTDPAEQTIFQPSVPIQIQTKAPAKPPIESSSQPLQPEAQAQTTPLATPVASDAVTAPEEVSTETIKEDNVAMQHYSFYEGLGQTEVVVDVEPIAVKLESPYYIQAGSFGSEAVALQEQKRLKRLGQITQVSALHTATRTYYRIRVGPFENRLILNKRRNELRRIGLGTLLIRAQ
jgi:cell division protein FtsN